MANKVVKIALYGQPLKYASVEEGATKGAQVGKNLYDANGNLITSLVETIIQAVINSTVTTTPTVTDDVVAVSTTPYNETLASGTRTLNVDATAANITINLPTAVGNTAKLRIKKIDSSAHTVTIDGNAAETIDGGATAVLTRQYESIDLRSNNANWGIY
jgi:hypothetical protein